MDLPTIKLKLNDVFKLYRGKTKEAVLANGNPFRREVLAESVFSLKDIADNLLDIIDQMQTGNIIDTCQNLAQEFKSLKESLPGLVKETIEGNFLLNADKVSGVPISKNVVKHSVLIKQQNDEAFDETAWNDVVKRNITQKLKSVPVKKSSLTKAGHGYLTFPTKEDQEKAEIALKSDFNITVSTKQPVKLLPKLKICNLYSYSRNEKDELKEAILFKNSSVKKLVDDGNTLDVVFIDDKNRYAVIKVSPQIRHEIIRQQKLFIDMEAHYVKDNWHLIQCFSCQQFGHKQGSDFCKNKSGGNNCLYCGGCHRSKDCLVKNESSSYKCINCAKSKNHQIKSAASGHTSTSRECPILIKEMQALMNRTEVSEEVKN